MERTAAHIAQGQIARLESFLPFLATTGNISPFVGLLGTVMGIIDSFREIGTQGTASISAVAPGVSEALIATAAGLFAAIPAVIAYNYFLTRIRRTAFRMDSVVVELLALLPVKTKEVPVGAPISRRDQRHPARGRRAGAVGDFHGDSPDALSRDGYQAADVRVQHDQAGDARRPDD
jgi:biopolymer transport protein TolQ